MEKKKATEAAQNKTLNRNDNTNSTARADIIQTLRCCVLLSERIGGKA